MWDDESNVDQLMKEHDDTCMPLPSIHSEPHLLISKVRKHYMEYMVKLLTANYESNQRLVNKNIYLPSAIWRCAKIMETKAAKDCMVVHLYRQSLLLMIKELKKDTSKGKLNKRLYECLHWPPENEKKVQVQISNSNIDECSCQCTCQNRNNNRKPSRNPEKEKFDTKSDSHQTLCHTTTDNFHAEDISAAQVSSTQDSHHDNDNSPKLTEPALLLDTHSQESDDLMTQLEKLFHSDPNDDDLFDTVFSDAIDSSLCDNVNKLPNGTCESSADQNTSSVIDTHAAQIKSLDERLTSLAGLWNCAENQPSLTHSQAEKPKTFISSKWNCEEHFLKTKLYDLLDQIGDCNRRKLDRVKQMLYELFGEDSDDEGVVSPMEETPEFIISCKERIAPWVVETLTPFYVKGRIKGKALFKLLAKHLIRIIYQCSHYPDRHEVHSFVNDFLKSHKTIRCEADFKQFKIENI